MDLPQQILPQRVFLFEAAFSIRNRTHKISAIQRSQSTIRATTTGQYGFNSSPWYDDSSPARPISRLILFLLQIMPSAMEDSKPKATVEVKQLQRYYTVLRDFMAYFHSRDEIYPPNHEVGIACMYPFCNSSRSCAHFVLLFHLILLSYISLRKMNSEPSHLKTFSSG